MKEVKSSVFSNILHKIGSEIKIGIEDAADSLKQEYNAKGNTGNDKMMIALKGIALVMLGVYAVLPMYNHNISVLVGALVGFFSSTKSGERISSTPSLIRGVFGGIFGAFVGTLIGVVPLVGVGLTIGIAKSIVDSIINIMQSTKSIEQSSISIIGERLRIGLLAGIIPIAGPLVVMDKLARERKHFSPKKIK